jgi:ribosome-binding ATPase
LNCPRDVFEKSSSCSGAIRRGVTLWLTVESAPADAVPRSTKRVCYDAEFMQTGIIGLPQVGKTTLFQILTKAHLAGKAGQGTHVGVAKVPEPRLEQLAKLYNPKKITNATVQYVDLGGMQKERMRDSLASLREVDAIAHVIRVFDDPSVPHSEGSIDPLRDATNLELELMLSDHDQIARRLERIEKDLKKQKNPALELEKTVLEKCKAHLEAEKPLRELDLSPEERKSISGFLFLSQRPMLYVLNLGDDEAAELATAVDRHKLGALQNRPNTAVVAVCGRLEAELAEMEEKEAAELLASYGLTEPGLNRLIRATYDLMGLIQFFTAGEPEVRAWTIRKGASAVKAAGEIHSDIEKGFIRAEVVRWNDLVSAGSIAAAKEKAQVRLEGRDYVVQEGDVILFRHSG